MVAKTPNARAPSMSCRDNEGGGGEGDDAGDSPDGLDCDLLTAESSMNDGDGVLPGLSMHLGPPTVR
jgi:hypothetical protein